MSDHGGASSFGQDIDHGEASSSGHSPSPENKTAEEYLCKRAKGARSSQAMKKIVNQIVVSVSVMNLLFVMSSVQGV